VSACTCLYKPVQALKDTSRKAKQAMSKIPQVKFRILFPDEK
jgi:hypothetical protein